MTGGYGLTLFGLAELLIVPYTNIRMGCGRLSCRIGGERMMVY